MSPTPSSVIPSLVSIVPYPFPPPPSVATLGHSSPTAIIVAWVLTAFLPIPLIVLIVVLRYFPDTLPIWLSQSPFPSWWRGKKPLSSSSSSGVTNATPSLSTLTVSNRTSQTLNGANYATSTPTRDGISVRGSLSPGTPQNSIETNYESPKTLSKSRTFSNTTDSPSKPGTNHSLALHQLPSCFESPKRLNFLESRDIPTTPRKTPSTRLSIPRSPGKQPLIDARATPHTLQRRRLKHRLLTSAILCVLIFSMYVVEGFAIAAAQTFAHARVLSHSDGKGGLGEGKENEAWLIPWVIYIVLQGGMVVGCAWMVWGLKRELMTTDREWKSEKGKGVERPDVIVLQGRTSRSSNTNAEEERFLPNNEAEMSGDLANSAAKVEPEGQEPEWQTLGYHPTFDSFSNRPDTNSAPIFQQFCQHERSDPNLNGEGSSRDFFSPGSSSSAPFPSCSLSLSFLPKKANPWSAERSHAEISLQRRNKGASKWSWPSAITNANKSPSAEDQTALLQSSLLGSNKDASERRNSWALEQSFFSSSSDEEETPSTSNKKKGKGKAKTIHPEEEEEEEIEPEETELTPHLPRSFLTGINLSQPYHFSDGLAYPLLPLAPRKPKHNPPPPPLQHPNSHNENTTPHTPPFSLPLPPRLLNHPAIAAAPTPFPYTPASSPRRTTFPPSSRAAHNNILFPPTPPASSSPPSSSPYRPSPLSPKRPRRPYLPPLRRAFVSPSPSRPLLLPRTPQNPSHLARTHAPVQTKPQSPPPLASPLSSPFPIFPSPSPSSSSKPNQKPNLKEQKQQQQPDHRTPTHTTGSSSPFNTPSSAFGSPAGFQELGSPRRVLRSLSARGRSAVGKKRHVYRRIEGGALGTVREAGGFADGEGEEGEEG
ncbi:MAG: hypothetical protein Q9184_000912 [Pyrenodesmia sp. 2 TL-2023]